MFSLGIPLVGSPFFERAPHKALDDQAQDDDQEEIEKARKGDGRFSQGEENRFVMM
jgi:hypothetical protein